MIYVFNENCVFFMICYLLVACGKKKGSGEEVGGGLDKFNHIHSYPTQLWPTWKHLQALTNLDFLIREVEVTIIWKVGGRFSKHFKMGAPRGSEALACCRHSSLASDRTSQPEWPQQSPHLHGGSAKFGPAGAQVGLAPAGASPSWG